MRAIFYHIKALVLTDKKDWISVLTRELQEQLEVVDTHSHMPSNFSVKDPQGECWRYTHTRTHTSQKKGFHHSISSPDAAEWNRAERKFTHRKTNTHRHTHSLAHTEREAVFWQLLLIVHQWLCLFGPIAIHSYTASFHQPQKVVYARHHNQWQTRIVLTDLYTLYFIDPTMGEFSLTVGRTERGATGRSKKEEVMSIMTAHMCVTVPCSPSVNPIAPVPLQFFTK